MKPTVSVAITTYNGERFLRKQLDSLFTQTLPPCEVIACDDHSNDSTLEILREYRGKHGLRYTSNELNIGFTRNFERVLAMCSGDLVALADQDDVWLPNKLELLAESIGEYSIVCSDAIFIDADDKTIAQSARDYAGLSPANGKDIRNLLFNNFVTGCTVLVKRELLATALPIPDYEVFHDWWLALMACKLDGVRYLDEQLVLYRKHGTNALGLTEKPGLKYKLLQSWFRRRDDFFGVQAKRLRGLSDDQRFTPAERGLFRDAHEFYADRLRPGLHAKAFLLALKYGDFIFPTLRGATRLHAVLGALFR